MHVLSFGLIKFIFWGSRDRSQIGMQSLTAVVTEIPNEQVQASSSAGRSKVDWLYRENH